MITDHQLDGVPFRQAADQGGVLVDPIGVLVHYTGGVREAPALDRLTTKDEDYLSAHLVIARDGSATQLVRFDRQAYHAGESSWIRGGVPRRCNSRFFGIELVNPGYARDGVRPPWPTVRAAHPMGGPVRDWYQYTEPQIARLREVLAALFHHYQGLRWILGHEDVSPGRKQDPGPAFPWHLIAGAVSGSQLAQLNPRPVPVVS